MCYTMLCHFHVALSVTSVLSHVYTFSQDLAGVVHHEVDPSVFPESPREELQLESGLSFSNVSLETLISCFVWLQALIFPHWIR